MNNKVLIVAYYWPPAGGGGVQRWVKFAKYLVELGFEPHVYVPENPSYPLIDETLLNEIDGRIKIIKNKILEPYEIYRRFTGASKTDKTNAGFISEENSGITKTKRIANWIRGNFFIPDARMLWIKPSIKFLKKYIAEEDISTLITTGPPHSMHLIGLGLKKKLKIKWIADFRDPWVNMDNKDEMMLSNRAQKKHERLEMKVLKTADEVVTVSWYLSSQYEKISGRKITTITNGYDTDDFDNSIKPDNEKFILGHYGTFGADRNSVNLWKAIRSILNSSQEFKKQLRIELIGPLDAAVKQSINEYGLSENVIYVDYLPHKEIIERMQLASVLMVITNQNANEEGRVTGKIFEYLASKRPILGIGSVTSDCARVIDETNTGKMCAHEDVESMKVFIQEQFRNFTDGKIELSEAEGERFTRKNLTRELIKIIQ